MRRTLGAIPLLRISFVSFVTIVSSRLRQVVAEYVVDPAAQLRVPSRTFVQSTFRIVMRHIKYSVSGEKMRYTRILDEYNVNQNHARMRIS